MTADQTATGLEIAVVGMAGRFPGARTVDALWQKLRRGEECISFFSDEELLRSGVDRDVLADPAYVKAGGIVDDVELFDAGFFGYSPREAALIDPQHRFFLEIAWTALENAGYAPGTFHGPIGVYGGVGLSDYLHKHVFGGRRGNAGFDPQEVIANDKDFLTTRVSYKLNLEGPSLTVQTACSTSLVAIHLACQALLAGECDMALAGAVTIRLPQKIGYFYQEEGIASPDGRCRAFSDRAQGCMPGNGAALVVLRRLADAVAAGDSIYAVVKGSAVNNDGAVKVGYTAPRVEGQARVIRSALAVAGTPADTIGYLEAHGTGTLIGDPIEIEAATQAFRHDTQKTGYCAVGSVKTNVGHLDAAAGVTGFIKAALAVKNGVIPPSLHCGRPNPRIDFENSPFFVNSTLRHWRPEDGVRRAAVSSFGIGGTNAHIVLEEPPAPSPRVGLHSRELVVVSAKTEGGVDRAAANLGEHLHDHPDLDLGDVAFTTRSGRAAFRDRRAVVCRDLREAAEALSRPPRTRQPAENSSAARRLVFMFPGQGSQYAGMGRELYETAPEFRRHIDAAAAFLAGRMGFDLREIICCPPAEAKGIADRLRDTRVAQPAIFSVSYALAQQFIAGGALPGALIGHSIGEYVAACVAGVLTFEDALWLVSERGLLMDQAQSGGMLAVPLGAAQLDGLLPSVLAVAALNAPDLTIVAGPTDAIDEFECTLRSRGIECRHLHTSHAFHSPMMDPVLEAFTARVARMSLQAPAIPYISNVTGTWVTAAEATSPEYWAQHLRKPVRFSEGLMKILSAGDAVLLEIGPGQTLTALSKRHARAGELPPRAFASMPPADHPDAGDAAFLEALGGIWSAGVDVNWSRILPNAGRRRVPLPTYPFERERHWLEPPAEAADAASHPRLDLKNWFSVPSWKRMPPCHDGLPASGLRWIVLVDNYGVAESVAARLAAAGNEVYTVRAGDRFARIGDRAFTINPRSREEYQDLCAALEPGGSDALRVLHCWSVERDADLRRGLEHLEGHQDRGFYSLMFLAQALAGQPWLSGCHVTVVTSHLYDVTGEERLCPEKATVIGPVRTLPLERAGFDCALVDVVVPGDPASRERLIDQLIDTIRDPSPHVVAIRGGHRWQQTLVPVVLDSVNRAPLVKDRGVYLITGGLGGLGLAIAEQLADSVRARLVLVGRRPLPPKDEWERWLSDDRIDSDARIAHLASAEDDIRARVPLSPMSDHQGLEEILDRLCCGYVLMFFDRAGIDMRQAQRVDRGELKRKCRVLPRFERLFDAMLRIVAEDGFATLNGSSVDFTGRADDRDVDDLQQHAIAKYPAMAPLFALLENCARSYDRALTGDMPALDRLFGDGNAERFKRAVANIRDHSYVPLCQAWVQELVSRIAGAERTRPLRVLEVGGGEGLLTDALLPLVAGRNIEYHFTDIGRSFVLNKQREAAARGYDFMHFGTLDISRPAVDQKFTPESFDLVLALNVVHATKRVADTLGHVRELLRPGGLLVMSESVRPRRWVDLIWGLTDGWWAFEDSDLRSASPLLELETWTNVLREAAFDSIVAFPRSAEVRSRADAGVIVARRPVPEAQNETRRRIEALRRLERSGAEVEVVSADVADRNQMQRAIDRAVDRFGTIDGVIHAALVLDDGPMQMKTRAAAARVLAPKVAGTLVLKELLAGRNLDFFMIFSSLVSLLGGRGQVDYCAASAFQDAFAPAERSLARSVISVNWGAWDEIGMAARAAAARGGWPEETLPLRMSPAEGLDAFLRVLAAPYSQVLVSPRNIAALIASRATGILSSPSVAPASEAALAPSVEEAAGHEPRNETERLIAGIWQEVLGVERVGVEDNFFDLGGDSIISLQFIARAKKAGLQFTNRQVFEHQTVARLAAVAAGGEQAAAI